MSKLNLGQALQNIDDAGTRQMLVSIQDAINNLGTNIAADPVGVGQTPAPLQSVNVKAKGEMVHVTLTHNVPVNKGVHYFLEYDNDPSFPQPHVLHNGTSRSIPPFSLPTLNDAMAPQNWYFRGYPQYPGSPPAAPVNFGGITPTPVTLTGTTALTLQPSTGSGTAAPDGRQGAQGFGSILARPAIAPKRNVSQ
jgi:hypothetical protein